MRKFTYGLPIALLSAAAVVAQLHKAVASIPLEVRAMARSAVPEAMVKRPPKAIASDEPNNAIAYNTRGFARYQSGDKQGAIDDFNHALQIDPNLAEAYNNRGSARNDLGDKQGAIADFQKAANLYVQQNRLDDYQRSLENIRKIQS